MASRIGSNRRSRKRNSSSSETYLPPSHTPRKRARRIINDPDDESDSGEQDFEVEQTSSLASASETVSCKYGANKASRQDVRLDAVLEVYTDPELRSRQAYKTSFFLNRGQNGASQPEMVGLINAYRIDKKGASNPGAKKLWVEELLKPDFTRPDGYENDPEYDDLPGRDTGLCMQAFFTKSGQVRSGLWGLRKQLKEKDVMYVDLVYTSEDHQGKGLLKPILKSFRSLLTKLPGIFAFDGVLVLVPARPPGAAGSKYGEECEISNEQETEIANDLTVKYGRADEFLVLESDREYGGQLIRVLGRLVDDVAHAAAVAAYDGTAEDEDMEDVGKVEEEDDDEDEDFIG